MKFKWTRIEKNVCTHWRIEIGEYTLVVEKTPGYDPVYGVFKGTERLINAAPWGGTVRECKKAAEEFYLSLGV